MRTATETARVVTGSPPGRAQVLMIGGRAARVAAPVLTPGTGVVRADGAQCFNAEIFLERTRP